MSDAARLDEADRQAAALAAPATAWAARWRAALADHMPLAVRGGRVAVDRRAAVALTLILLAGVALGVLSWWRARPVEDAAPPRVEIAGQATEDVASTPSRGRARRVSGGGDRTNAALSSGNASGAVVVDVEGRVVRPGLLTLPAGARVADALRLAGGAVPGVETSGLNLARVLADGEQLLVGVPNANPAPASPGGGASASAEGALVDLNAATVDQLRTLPGIGPVLAQHVLEWRGAHGRFTSVDQLREVGGIGPRKLARLRTRVRI